MVAPERSSEPAVVGQRLPAKLRLARDQDFQRVFENRRSVADDWLILYACFNQLGYSRVGLTVSRKVGNAVVRNRWKRMIREAFRRRRHEVPVGVDFVVLPKRGRSPDGQRISDSLVALAKRLKRRLEPT